jgi:heptosyltransferase III
MHLASAVGVPTLGLFSRDNLDKYEPYGGHNAAISTRGGVSARDTGQQAADWLDRLRALSSDGIEPEVRA